MEKQTLEHISSLMDGELSHETSLFVARRMGTDERLGATWARYHLIRECLRSPGSKWAVMGWSLDLDGAAADGAGYGRAQPAVQRWLRPVAGLAIAASVALVAILTAMPDPVNQATGSEQAARPFASPNTLTAVPVSQPASYSGDAATQRRLNTYLLRHNQVTATAGRQGFVSFVPIVTAAPVKVVDPEELRSANDAGDAEPEQHPRP